MSEPLREPPGEPQPEHPVVRARKPFGLFLNILDFKLTRIDGKPVIEKDGNEMWLRLDSKGRIFRKSPETNNLWEKISDPSKIWETPS